MNYFKFQRARLFEVSPTFKYHEACRISEAESRVDSSAFPVCNQWLGRSIGRGIPPSGIPGDSILLKN